MALAIALGRDPPHHDDPPEGPDSFLADHGFEYIDGERTHHPEIPSVSVSEENDPGSGVGVDVDDDDDDIQGLPRVIDALSTIMWPTMVRERDNGGDGKRKSQLRPSLFDIDDILHREDGELEADEEEETLAALMAADAVDHGAPQTRASRMQREMQALERWLVENEEMHGAEFGGAVSTMVMITPRRPTRTKGMRTRRTRRRTRRRTKGTRRRTAATRCARSEPRSLTHALQARTTRESHRAPPPTRRHPQRGPRSRHRPRASTTTFPPLSPCLLRPPPPPPLASRPHRHPDP